MAEFDESEDEVSPAPTDDEAIGPRELAELELDPALAQARANRDKELGLTNLAQGITDIGASLASQGRIHSNSGVFDAARKEAELKATDAQKDALSNRQIMMAHLKAKQAAARQAVVDGFTREKIEVAKDQNAAIRGERAAARDKPSDANNLSAGYGKRMEQAEQDFSDVAKGGYNRADISSGVDSALADTPLVGGAYKALFQGKNTKLQEQAEKNFLSAVLRRESGASIAPSEREEGANQYFPRAGDTKEVLEQKARNRQQALNSLKASSGTAWEKTPLVPGGQSGGDKPQTKVVNGKTYQKVPGGWQAVP